MTVSKHVTVLDAFWQVVTQGLESRGVGNHMGDSDHLGICMPEVRTEARRLGVQLPAGKALLDAVRTCPRFVRISAVRSRIRRSTVRCWVFKK
jgi:hypothetical protein